MQIAGLIVSLVGMAAIASEEVCPTVPLSDGGNRLWSPVDCWLQMTQLKSSSSDNGDYYNLHTSTDTQIRLIVSLTTGSPEWEIVPLLLGEPLSFHESQIIKVQDGFPGPFYHLNLVSDRHR